MPKGKKQKVIILGIDGFDPEVINFLMQKGKLPSFKKLAELGAFSKLATTMPPASPVAWTTMATGVGPGQHGIFDFVQLDRKKYLPRIAILKQENGKYFPASKSRPFWKILEEKKIAASIVRWPLTFPADSLQGCMLTGLGTPEVQGMLNNYVRFTNKKNLGLANIERIQKLTVNGDYVEGEFCGPIKDGYQCCRESFVVQIINAQEATLRVQDNVWALKKNQWSDWIEVEFRGRFGKKTQSICKIFVQQLVGDIDFFVTSMQFDPENSDAEISFPGDYASSLAAKIGRFYTLGMPEDARAVNDYNLSKKALQEQIEGICIEREKMFWSEFEKLIKDEISMLGIIFDETDRGSHMFLAADVKWDQEKVLSVGKYIEKIYKSKDVFLGKILKSINEDVALVVVSDHGFKPFEKKVNLNNWLMEQGYLKLIKGATLKNAGMLYQRVDWSKTKAYATGYFSININLEGREGKGIVKKDRKKMLEKEIMEKLSKLVDGDNGKSVIDCAQTRDQLYYGKYIEDAADISVGFNWPYRIDWNCPAGGFGNATIEKNEKLWQADHLISPNSVPGIFFSNFKISSKSPGVLDIAPTLLDFLDIEAPMEYEGETLRS